MISLSKLLNNFHLGRQGFAETAVNLSGFFYIRIYLIINIGINLLSWLFAYIININVSQELVVLHYNIDFGVNLIGNVKQIYIIPFLGLIIVIVNVFLLLMIYDYANQAIGRIAEPGNENEPVKLASGKIIANFLLAGSLLANFFLLAGLSSIYLINFFR